MKNIFSEESKKDFLIGILHQVIKREIDDPCEYGIAKSFLDMLYESTMIDKLTYENYFKLLRPPTLPMYLDK